MTAQAPVSVSTYSGAGTPSVAPGAAPAAPQSASGALVPVAAPAAPAAAPTAQTPAPDAAAAAAAAAPAVAAPPPPLDLSAAPAADDAAAQAAAAQAAADAGAPGVEYSYDKTGNAGLDMALSFLGKNGYGPDHPAMKAAAAGNFALLKAELAAKNVPGAAEHLALGEEAYKAHSAAREAKEKEDREGIYRVVGGEEAWGAIQKWAASNADADEKASIGAALRGGGIVARATAAYLAQQYERAAGTTIKPGQVQNPNASAASLSQAPLTAQEYRQGIADLKAKFGPNGLDQRPEYKALAQRYQAGLRRPR